MSRAESLGAGLVVVALGGLASLSDPRAHLREEVRFDCQVPARVEQRLVCDGAAKAARACGSPPLRAGQVLRPATCEIGEASPDELAALGVRIDVNEGSAGALQSLPGIGPAYARRIIEGRPYASVDELERVKGVGPRRLERLRDRACVRCDQP